MGVSLINRNNLGVPSGVLSRTSLLMHKLGIEVERRAEPRLQKLGITGRQYAALAILDSDQPRSQHELGQLMGHGGQIIVGLADELEHLGLVERKRSTHDRRRIEIILTKSGKELLVEADALGQEIEYEMLGTLSVSERAVFNTTVRRIMESQWIPCDTNDI